MTNHDSRATLIDTNLCTENVGGNRFNLVLIAAQRAREISHNNHHSDRHEHIHTPVTALLEIQEGKIGIEYLEKFRKKRK